MLKDWQWYLKSDIIKSPRIKIILCKLESNHKISLLMIVSIDRINEVN